MSEQPTNPENPEVTAVQQQIELLRKDMENQEERLRRDIDVLRNNITLLKWLFGIIAAGIVSYIVAVVSGLI